MNVNIYVNTDPKTIEEFADHYRLTMEVRERSLSLHYLGRYMASFEDAEVKDGSVLISTFGNGDTPEEAISDYARQIEGKLMVIDAFKPNRNEIWVPEFVKEIKVEPTHAELMALWNVCKKFVEDQNIGCAETIYQTDWVIENAYEFVEQVCNVVGYQPYEEDE